MRYKELFKVYNWPDFKKNKGSMILISVAIFLAMLVSLVLPQIQYGKQEYINSLAKMMNDADLMIEQNYSSVDFDHKLQEYEKDGMSITRVSASPIYIESGGNKIMIYLMSGYDNLGYDEAIISKGLSDKNMIQIGDSVSVSGLTNKDKIKITGIEPFPTDVYKDAEVAGYIKVRNLESTFISDTQMIFVSGLNGEQIKSELKDIEEGYKYYTFEDRQEQLYQYIDQQIGALSLISSVGYILSIAILISGIIMMIIKNKRDLASLMLIPVPMKDIKKSLKLEVNIIIFVPLLLAVATCIPLAMYFLSMEGITAKINMEYIANVGKFIAFDVIIFILYRNFSLRFIDNINPVFVEKGENGLAKPGIIKTTVLIISIPITLVVYSIMLQSEISVSANIILILAIVLFFALLYILISLITRLPLWKHWNSSLYAFSDMRSNKLFITLAVLNLTMLSVFILAGFNLGETLKNSVELNYKENVPYNYMLRSTSDDALENELSASKNVKGFLKLNYLDARVNNEEIRDKKIRMNEVASKDTGVDFKILKGKGVFEGDLSEIVISDSYAKAYDLKPGDTLSITESGVPFEYVIKGIYDAGGVNVTWILKASEDKYKNAIFLADFANDEALSEIKNCYIADINSAGSYLLIQMENFLKSFRYMSIIFILASFVFNINISYMSLKMSRKNYAIMKAISVNKKIMIRQIVIKGVFTVAFSVLVSTFLYVVLMGIVIGMTSKGGITFESGTFLYVVLLLTISVSIGNLSLRGITDNYLEEIRE